MHCGFISLVVVKCHKGGQAKVSVHTVDMSQVQSFRRTQKMRLQPRNVQHIETIAEAGVAMCASSVAPKTKMFFSLEADEDGYPPVSIEGLWVRSLDAGTAVLDNIPFYAQGIAPGDVLSIVRDSQGEVWFRGLLKSAGASVFRIHASTEIEVARVREELLDLGLPSEVDAAVRLVAVEVPVDRGIGDLLSYLMAGQEANRFDFEEGVLRHAMPD
jgi:Domain of unknown function (DUF4265)